MHATPRRSHRRRQLCRSCSRRRAAPCTTASARSRYELLSLPLSPPISRLTPSSLLSSSLSTQQCAIREADELKRQLQAFVNAHGASDFQQRLLSKAHSLRMRGILCRRRRLLERAEESRAEAEAAAMMLEALETSASRATASLYKPRGLDVIMTCHPSSCL